MRTFLLLALVAVLAAPAAAQTLPADSTRATPLDTLSVRVLGSAVSVFRAPYSITVVDAAEAVRARPGLALNDALSAIPGVQVDNRFNYALGERISIRGFGARAQFGVRGVRVLVDGVPATLPDGQTTLNHVDVASLGRAEVIRGPAAALYGNASGGVIEFTSVEAPDSSFASESSILGGSHGLLRARTSVGGRLGSSAYRASITRLRYGGYRSYSDADNTLLNAHLARAWGRDRLRLSLAGVRYDARNPGSLSDSLLRVDRTQAFSLNRTRRTGERGTHAQIGALWERSLAAGTLAVSTYGILRELDNPIPVSVIDLSRRAGGARALFRSASDAATALIRWSVGTEMGVQRDDRRNFGNEDGERGALQRDQREGVTTAAGFVQAAASPLERLEILAALRYDHFRFSVDDRFAVTDANPDDSGSRTLAAWSPTVGASFAVAERVNLYANFATAFETPTTTELANRPSGAGGFNPDLEPQRTRSWEIGGRTLLGSARLELAAYHARVRDALVPFEVEGAPGRQFFRNAGTSTHRGIEAAAVLAPAPWVRGRAAYTFTDARFDRYGGENGRFDGNSVPGIAPHRLEATLGFRSDGGAFANLDGRYAAATPVDDANLSSSPGFTLFDVRGGWELASRRGIRAVPFLGVSNLFDRAYNASVVVNARGSRFFEPGPGRAWFAGVDVRL